MSDVLSWLEQKVRLASPGPELVAGDVGRQVNDLARAHAAIERGVETAFGLHLEPAQRQEAQPLLGMIRGTLEAWSARLERDMGGQGVTFVETIAGRHGISIARKEPATEARVDLVALIEETVSQPEALARSWKDRGPAPGNRIAVWTGAPEPEALEATTEMFSERFGVPFPPPLRALLTRFNGLAVGERETSGPGRETVRPAQLVEPILWPAGPAHDHLLLADIDLAKDQAFYVIGELADSGLLALGIADGSAALTGVHWIDGELGGAPPVLLAPTIEEFVQRWCAAGLCLPVVLAQAEVPGWS